MYACAYFYVHTRAQRISIGWESVVATLVTCPLPGKRCLKALPSRVSGGRWSRLGGMTKWGRMVRVGHAGEWGGKGKDVGRGSVKGSKWG